MLVALGLAVTATAGWAWLRSAKPASSPIETPVVQAQDKPAEAGSGYAEGDVDSMVKVQVPITSVEPPEREAVRRAMDGTMSWAKDGFNHNDPRLRTLADALRGHLGAALDHWRDSRDPTSYADEAMERAILLAIQAEDHELVIPALTEAPFLAECLIPRGWAVKARPVVRAMLANEEQRLPQPAVVLACALAEAVQPEDVPVLVQVLKRLNSGADQAMLAERMKSIPGCDWQHAVREAWGARANTDYGDRQLPLAQLAAESGVVSGFAACGDALAVMDKAGKAKLRIWLLTQPALGGELQSRSWFREVSGKVEFRDGLWSLRTEAVEPPPVRVTPQRVQVVPPDPPLVPPPPGLSAMADGPTVRGWLDEHAKTVAERKNMRRSDPLIALLAAVPPSRYDELLRAERQHRQNFAMRSALQQAIRQSTRQQHHDLVMAALAEQPFLIEVVASRGWSVEAAPFLRRFLAQPGPNFAARVDAVQALADVGDPADYYLLSETMSQMRMGYWQAAMARSLANMPGFDLDTAVRRAWRRFPRGDYSDRQDGFAIAAARAGIADAMPIAVAHATGGETGHSSEQLAEEARDFLASTFAVERDAEAIRQWWSAVGPSVHWDAATRRWKGDRPVPTAGSAAGF